MTRQIRMVEPNTAVGMYRNGILATPTQNVPIPRNHAVEWGARERELPGPEGHLVAGGNQMPNSTATGVLYAIFNPAAGAVKIGRSRSEHDVRNRLNVIQTSSPSEVVLLRVWPGSEADEKWLHAELAGHRIRGEWFVACPEVGDQIGCPLQSTRHRAYTYDQVSDLLKAAHKEGACELFARVVSMWGVTPTEAINALAGRP